MMSEADHHVYSMTNTTMQHGSTGFWLSDADENDDNTTDEKLDFSYYVGFFRPEIVVRHGDRAWSRRYGYGVPLATRDILYFGSALMGESSGQATIGEGPIWTIVPRREFRIAPEAERRILGYEWLMQYLYEIVYDEMQRQRVSLRQLEVRPAWSNEYDDTTGVVIDVSIEGSVEQRFALWEVISSKIEALEAYMRPGDREFFTSSVSIIVNRK